MTTKTASPAGSVRYDVNQTSDQDLYLFNEGSHYRMHDKLGAHLTTVAHESGACFGVWAPNGREVSVVGSFNDWNPQAHPLQPRGSSGIWEGFVPAVRSGLEIIGQNIRDNVNFFNQGIALEISQRYQYLFLIGICGIWGLLARRACTMI